MLSFYENVFFLEFVLYLIFSFDSPIIGTVLKTRLAQLGIELGINSIKTGKELVETKNQSFFFFGFLTILIFKIMIIDLNL